MMGVDVGVGVGEDEEVGGYPENLGEYLNHVILKFASSPHILSTRSSRLSSDKPTDRAFVASHKRLIFERITTPLQKKK